MLMRTLVQDGTISSRQLSRFKLSLKKPTLVLSERTNYQRDFLFSNIAASAVVKASPVPAAKAKSKSSKKSKGSSSNNFARYSAEGKEIIKRLSASLRIDSSSKDYSSLLELCSSLPSKYFKPNSSPHPVPYLIDDQVAKEVSSVIVKDVAEKGDAEFSTPCLEINPGFGVLTRRLVAAKIKNLTLLEDNPLLVEFLRDRYPEVSVIKRGIRDLPRIHHSDKLGGESRISKLLAQVLVESKTQPASEIEKHKKPSLIVTGTLSQIGSLSFIIKSKVTSTVFYNDDLPWTDPIFYVILESKPYGVVSSRKEEGYFLYRPVSVLFQTLFKTSVIKEYSSRVTIPWMNPPKEGKSKKYLCKNTYDVEKLYLLKIETNYKLIEELGQDQLLNFWYFVRHHLFARRNCVVAQLEQWVPGCGARLVRKGYTIYTQFGELNPQEILELYKEFMNWPEFLNSSFITAVEKFSSKVEGQDSQID